MLNQTINPLEGSAALPKLKKYITKVKNASTAWLLPWQCTYNVEDLGNFFKDSI
jgi:hypothetical protein